ncbi:MAG TPA: hypothetical protein DIS94_04660 [Bacteroidetes bacterium]|nr:hypothetical protein [Bacteroidota bacterium]
MNRIILIVILIICNKETNSQWIQQPLGTTGAIYDVQFLDSNYGWSCGSGGFLRKTTNGGLNWLIVNHPVGGKLFGDLHIVDSNTIYVVGQFETIIKTTNAGENWTVIRNSPQGLVGSYYACYFLNSQTGWVSGANIPPIKMFKTTNGGLTFDSVTIPQATEISDIYFKNENEGLASGYIRDLYKTTNGGLSWFNCEINLPTNWPSFLKMSFINGFTGWIPAGDGRVFKTTNFGSSWDSISKIEGVGNSFMQCIKFVDEETGWIGGEDGKLYKSTDGGLNWLQENIGLGNFVKLDFINDHIGWICGPSGKMYHTTTGGQTVSFIENNISSLNEFELLQNYPNPFNPITKIRFSINKLSDIKLIVYDINGREIVTLVNGKEYTGQYEVTFDGNELPSGVYFYSLIINGLKTETKKMILIK